MDDEVEEISVIKECVSCFYLDTVIRDPNKTYHEMVHLCDYCRENPLSQLEGPEKLERILQIMNRTSAHQMPNILRLMYKVLK